MGDFFGSLLFSLLLLNNDAHSLGKGAKNPRNKRQEEVKEVYKVL